MSRAARRKPAAAFTVGSVVAQRYRLEKQLGEGGMAEVFRAEDIASGRRVAVKILRPEIATNPEAVERTKREGELLSQIDNPAIVQVETFGQLEDGTVFLVMELLEGETLGERIRRGPLDPAELAPIVAGTCAGLHAAHSRGIVHRDLKPDNVFLCPTEHGLQVKLLDFGISKVYGGQKLTQTGEVLGTPRYMSPEQLGAEPDVDARVDVYALGVILYEALSGKPPFLASTPTDLIIAILNGKVAPLRSLRPDLPAGVESVVMRAMSKVRAARFDTAMAMAEAYIDAAGGVAAVRGAQRRGMATRAMGGMKAGGSTPPPPGPGSMPGTRPPPTPPGGDEVAGNLRIGTFSGLEASPAPIEPAAPIDKRTVAMGAAAGTPVPEAPGDAVARAPELDKEWLGRAATQEVPVTSAGARREVPMTRETPLDMMDEAPAVPAPRAVPATALIDMSQAPASAPVPARAAPPPRRGASKLLLVAGALFAGAASAGAVILGLHLYDQHRREAEPGVETAPEAVPTEQGRPPEAVPVPEPAEGVAPEEGAAPQAGGEPVEEPGEATTPEAEEPEEPGRATRERRDRRRTEAERDGQTISLPGFGDILRVNGPGGSEPARSDPMAEAQRALRAGDPQRCIDVLTDAIRERRAPGTLAVRRRGDCYEAAGQRESAIRDYQQFCRLAGPDHPNIAEVRPLLESWGRTCP
ncbi:MAG: serine/threonine protein kinase [Sandaracinaceae bacterium]|nr:serine/threonine protein kinase [Sandaracinaceae bacterium]